MDSWCPPLWVGCSETLGIYPRSHSYRTVCWDSSPGLPRSKAHTIFITQWEQGRQDYDLQDLTLQSLAPLQTTC